MEKNEKADAQEAVVISVLCFAYNHVGYIRDALEGCLSQKTSFHYEIIVHDDASTDGTAEIVREYAEEYPDRIIPVLQTENQYSKGTDIPALLLRHARGRYIAICECDDSLKLQKQYEALRAMPGVIACVHNAWKLDCRTNSRELFSARIRDGELRAADIIAWGNRGYATASLVVDRKYLLYPDGFRMNRVGDYPRAAFLALSGKIYFLKDAMSVYRFQSAGSWSLHNSGDKAYIKAHTEDLVRMLGYADEFSEGKYHKEIVRHKDLVLRDQIFRQRREGDSKNEYQKEWEALSPCGRIAASVLYPLSCMRHRMNGERVH